MLRAASDAHDNERDRNGDEARRRPDDELETGVSEPARKKEDERGNSEDELDDWNVIRIRRHKPSNAQGTDGGITALKVVYILYQNYAKNELRNKRIYEHMNIWVTE